MSDAALKVHPKQGRSPAYPGIALKVALEKAQALLDAEVKYAVPVPSAFKAWGFGHKSSGGRVVRAALRYYGLITNEGDGENGKIKLTDDALRVLLDKREDQSEKKAIIRRLATNPAIHKKIAEAFPDGIKSDATVEHFLMFEGGGYNKVAAAEIVAEFKDTAAYAGLYEPAIIPVSGGGKLHLINPSAEEEIGVGDLVQVEVNGALALEKPDRVRAIQEHDGRRWAFVESSTTGIPMEQVTLIEKGGSATTALDPRLKSVTHAPQLPLMTPPIAHSATPVESEWIRGPIGNDVTYRIIVNGKMGPKEIGKLIRVLKAQQVALSDDDEGDEDRA
jgi:hypothetical protein